MPSVNAKEIISYSADQMFALVNDVETYPQFLPWCRAASVDRITDTGIIATVTVAKGPLQHAFTTQNVNDEPRRIDMSLVAGPFRHFHGVWRFEDVDGGCRVALNIDFEFSNRFLANALSAVFKRINASMIDAFRKRAREIYG